MFVEQACHAICSHVEGVAAVGIVDPLTGALLGFHAERQHARELSLEVDRLRTAMVEGFPTVLPPPPRELGAANALRMQLGPLTADGALFVVVLADPSSDVLDRIARLDVVTALQRAA
jgi:hypothetical protein